MKAIQKIDVFVFVFVFCILNNLVDTEGPRVDCPEDVFGLTNDNNARTSVQWSDGDAYDNEDDSFYQVTCRDDDEGRVVKSGDLFKVGTNTVTCTASDAAGNPGQCTFGVTVTGL